MLVRAKFTVVLLVFSIGTAAAAQSAKHKGNGGNGGNGGNRSSGDKGKAGKHSEALPYQSGEIRVTIQGNRNPVVPLGLALNGAIVVEFPVGESYYGIHTSDLGDWVRIEKSPTRLTDNHIVLRPGKDLAQGDSPAASITMQMRSGLLITLWVYRAKSVKEQTRRCVISYDPNEIIAARKKDGLATAIGKVDVGSSVTAAAAADGQAAPPAQAAATDNKAVPELKSGSPDRVAADLDLSNEDKKTAPSAPLKELLDEAVAKPKQFRKWTPTSHGISVSISPQTREMNFGRIKVALVAIRNTKKDHAITLLDGHPEIAVETLNAKGKTLQITPIRKLRCESSTSENVVPAGSTVFYAIAFAPPMLAERQWVRVAVGQINAADDPIAVNLIK